MWLIQTCWHNDGDGERAEPSWVSEPFLFSTRPQRSSPHVLSAGPLDFLCGSPRLPRMNVQLGVQVLALREIGMKS